MKPHSQFGRHWPLLLLAIVTALAAWLRLQQAGESHWVDELHTAWCIEGSLAEVSARAAVGNQSPLYFYVEWFIARAFGASELSLRVVSLACGIALPVALYGLMRHWTNAADRETSILAAVVAAALVTLDPLSIFYAQEARPYACVQLLAVAHIFVFSRLLVQPAIRWRALWILSAATLFYLHYTAALLIAAEAFYFALASAAKLKPAYRPLPFLVDIAVLGILWLPAMPQILEIAARRENWAAFVHTRPVTAILTLFPWSLGALFIVTEILIHTNLKRKQGVTTSPTALLPSRAVEATLLCIAWMFVPVSIAWLTTKTGVAHVFFERYLIASQSASFLLTALCIPLAPSRLGRYALAIACAAAAIYTSGIVQQLRYDGRVHALRQEDWRGAIAYLNSELPAQRLPVLVRSGLIESDALRDTDAATLREYCLYPVASLYPLDAPAADLIPLPMTNAGQLSPEVQRRIVRRGGAWLVLRGSKEMSERFKSDVHASFSNPDLQPRFHEPQSFGNVWVIRLEITSTSN